MNIFGGDDKDKHSVRLSRMNPDDFILLFAVLTCKERPASVADPVFRRGVPTRGGQNSIWPIFPEHCMKMKKFVPRRLAAVDRTFLNQKL